MTAGVTRRTARVAVTAGFALLVAGGLAVPGLLAPGLAEPALAAGTATLAAGGATGTYATDGTGPWVAPVVPGTDRTLTLTVGEPRTSDAAPLTADAFSATQGGTTLTTTAERVPAKNLAATVVLDRDVGADELSREQAGALAVISTVPTGLTVAAVAVGPTGQPAYTETKAAATAVVNAARPGSAPSVDAQLAVVTPRLLGDTATTRRDVVVLGPCRTPTIPQDAVARVWLIPTSGTCSAATRAAITGTGGRIVEVTGSNGERVAGNRFVAALAGIYQVSVTATPGGSPVELTVRTGTDGTVRYQIPAPLAHAAGGSGRGAEELLGLAGGAVIVGLLLVAVVRIGRGRPSGDDRDRDGDGPADEPSPRRGLPEGSRGRS